MTERRTIPSVAPSIHPVQPDHKTFDYFLSTTTYHSNQSKPDYCFEKAPTLSEQVNTCRFLVTATYKDSNAPTRDKFVSTAQSIIDAIPALNDSDHHAGPQSSTMDHTHNQLDMTLNPVVLATML